VEYFLLIFIILCFISLLFLFLDLRLGSVQEAMVAQDKAPSVSSLLNSRDSTEGFEAFKQKRVPKWEKLTAKL
jgi:hypothetical protein